MKNLSQNNNINFEETEKVDSGSCPSKAISAKRKKAITVNSLKEDLEMYEIQSFLGVGSCGMVYKAMHKQLGRQVAIKMLHSEYFENLVVLENFRKEAQLISRIKHQNVASVYDFIEINGHYYIIMELIDGQNLQTKFNNEGFTEEEILNIMLGLLEGIRFTHMKNVLHLDIKPSNIIINDFGDPLIVDFGISHFKEPNLKGDETEILGTPFYMAPEQFTRSLDIVDFRADLYSLGIVFYQMITGCLPFKGDTFDEIRNKVLLKEPKMPSLLNNKISRDLEAIILKMIRKNSNSRYMDAQSIIDDIHRYQKGEPVQAMQYRRIAILRSWILRNKAISFLSLLVILVGLTFLGYFLYQKYQRTPQWKRVFKENFNRNFSKNWEGYMGMTQSSFHPIKQKDFDKYFMNRIKVLSFKKENDLVLTAKHSFEKNIRLKFQWNVNPEENSKFGIFINATDLKEDELGYILYFEKDKIFLKKDNILKTNFLWDSDFRFENDKIYNFEIEVVEDRVKLFINDEIILNFQDFVTGFTKMEYKMGFFAKSSSIEIDNLEVYELNKALLSTPLDIPDRFFQYEQYESAVDEYSRIINKYPDNRITIEAYYFRGLAYAKLDETQYALNDFDRVLSYDINAAFRGKTYYQKAQGFLRLGQYNNAFKNFNKAMEIFNVSSLRLVVLNSIVNLCRVKIASKKSNEVDDALLLFRYLTTLNIEEPARMTFVDIPKNIAIFYFDVENHKKSIDVLKLIMKFYPFREDIYAFALWKTGRAYYEWALKSEGEDVKLSKKNKTKAIEYYRKVLIECPDVRIYQYFSYEELSRVYRSLGNFRKSMENQKLKNKMSDVFF